MKITGIKKIIKKKYSGKVYDIVLDKIHLFYAKYGKSWKRNILIHNSQPDIDIDFEAGTDEKTLQFLYDKYGKERVVPVVTFGTFNEKGCLKDVTKALQGADASGFNSEVFAVTKEMPQTPSWPEPMDTLEKWIIGYPETPECSDLVRNWLRNPDNADVLKYTLKLQGQVRNLGKHAAGIVITPGPVWESMPVNISKGQIVSGFQESGVAKDLSSLGILKLDRLKLETLNVIKDAEQYILKNYGEEVYNKVCEEVDYVDLYDDNLFTELRLGNNQGIFQFESNGMNSLIKGMQVEKFEELVACNALYRPGPMNMKMGKDEIGAHEQYIQNKFHPEKIEYPHKALKPILSKTNGVLIYQEQLMFIAHEIAGMSLGEGDNLRKVMDNSGKIIAKKLNGTELSEDEKNNKHFKDYEKLWKKFIDGAIANGFSEDDVNTIEAWLVQYLGYSFNRCLTKNHTVDVKDKGKINISDIKHGDLVLSHNTKTGENEYKQVKEIHHNGVKKVYRIKTKTGKIVECTLDHKFLTKNGMQTLEYVLANDLEIMTFN